MKPYGLRPGDGTKSYRKCGLNKFDRLKDKGGPRGKNKASKIHKQRCLCHKQARQDARRQIRNETA